MGGGWEARANEFCEVSSVNARPAYHPSINSCATYWDGRGKRLSPLALFSLLISLRQVFLLALHLSLYCIASTTFPCLSDVGLRKPTPKPWRNYLQFLAATHRLQCNKFSSKSRYFHCIRNRKK